MNKKELPNNKLKSNLTANGKISVNKLTNNKQTYSLAT